MCVRDRETPEPGLAGLYNPSVLHLTAFEGVWRPATRSLFCHVRKNM